MDIPDINLADILEYTSRYNELPKEPEYSLRPFNIQNSPRDGLFRNYLKSINPTELYHGGDRVFNRFDPNMFGSSNGMYTGYGAYLTDNPKYARAYGDKISRFYLPQSYQLSNYDNAFINNINYFKSKYPFLTKDIPEQRGWVGDLFGKNMANFLDKKGIAGTTDKIRYNTASEYVVYDPNKLSPANTPMQRIANRFFNPEAIRYGSRLFNRASIPYLIYQGLSQPVARDEDMLLKGGIKYYGE